MQLPIVAPAPIVTAHADIFRDLFENRCQFRHSLILDSKVVELRIVYTDDIPFHDP
jgi:hypothetical protein